MNINLESLEKKFGGFISNIPVNKNSIYDKNFNKNDCMFYTGINNNITKLQCGGDRMSSCQMGYGIVYKKIIEYLYEFSEIKNILEIGILTGIGLAMWSELFPTSIINGFDIDLSNFNNNKENLIQRGAFKNNNVFTYEFDQYDPDISLIIKLSKINKYDFIIDDGCHADEAIISTFSKLYPYLNKNFIYVIEDNYEAYKILLNKYKDIIATNIEQITVITYKDNTKIHNELISINKLNSIKHSVYFNEKKQIISHSTNNGYGNILLKKYNIGDIIQLNKEKDYIELYIINKIVKEDKVILYFENNLSKELLENRRGWVIIKLSNLEKFGLILVKKTIERLKQTNNDTIKSGLFNYYENYYLKNKYFYFSHEIFIMNYINNNYSKKTKILEIAAGCGQISLGLMKVFNFINISANDIDKRRILFGEFLNNNIKPENKVNFITDNYIKMDINKYDLIIITTIRHDKIGITNEEYLQFINFLKNNKDIIFIPNYYGSRGEDNLFLKNYKNNKSIKIERIFNCDNTYNNKSSSWIMPVNVEKVSWND